MINPKVKKKRGKVGQNNMGQIENKLQDNKLKFKNR